MACRYGHDQVSASCALVPTDHFALFNTVDTTFSLIKRLVLRWMLTAVHTYRYNENDLSGPNFTFN